jgi:SAM-dependent methyltransferase
MSKSEQDSSYYAYLTERMDRGESKNIVMPTVVDLITQHLETKTNVSVLDMGCFNGAMLNQIRTLTPERLRSRVSYNGAEIDESLVSDGRKRYPSLNFEQADLTGSITHLGLHDIVILSNVLHEVVPNESESVNILETAVGNTVRKVATITIEGGSLVVLDGIKPDEDTREVVLKHTSAETLHQYNLFAEEYMAFEVHAEDVEDRETKTRVKDLAAFLTKARYLTEEYWQIERQQLYQFFTRDQFIRTIESSGFSIERFEPQRFSDEQKASLFDSVTPAVEIPAKNVLIVARRV